MKDQSAPTRMIHAASESCADLLYATGFMAPDPFLFVQEPGGKRHLVTSLLEVDRARRTARVDAVHTWDAVKSRLPGGAGSASVDTAELIRQLLAELDAAEVLVPGDFPLGLADRLRQQGVKLLPAPGEFWPEREFKQEWEVTALRAALRVTALGMAAGIELLRASAIGEGGKLYLEGAVVTSARVRAAIHSALVSNGAIPSHTIVAGGLQGADPHEEGSGELAAHQPIIIDIFPRMSATGYWGDMTRTVCRGTPPPRLRAAWEAVLGGQELAMGLIRDGAAGAEIHRAVSAHLTAAGFPTGTTPEGRQSGFFHGTGHGLGLEIHELPRIGTRDYPLRRGNVVTVEPGVYYPEWGGVRLEDVVVVGETGCENLTEFPKFLEI